MTVSPETKVPKRPLLRYHGGKWRLAGWIISHLPPHRGYVEPFCGAASVLLRKPRSYSEVINDLDGELVNLHRVVRDRGGELVRALRRTPFARAGYYEAMKPAGEALEDARRLIVRSYQGFGSDSHNTARRSGFRANSNRSHTTPAHDWASYPRALVAIMRRLQGVVIENRDALKIIAQQDSPRTLFYCDPPYLMETRSDKAHSNHCYAHEMSDRDHVALAEVLRGVKGMVVLSGYESELYRDLYAGWRTVTKETYADGARPRTEMLWTNAAADEALAREVGAGGLFQ